ncbi:MAG TPA: hypothetical protein VMU66_04800, partial [Gaiellales bacterium]|nr:hypothetical protein [Gaiellales bacterium]
MAEPELPDGGRQEPASFLLTDLVAVATAVGLPPLRGAELNRVEVTSPGAIAVRDGVIAGVGAPAELARFEAHLPVVSGAGLV